MFENKKIKILKNALQALLSCDKQLYDKLRRCKPDIYGDNRDIALALVLESKGILDSFDTKVYSSPHAIDQVLEKFEKDHGIFAELKSIIEDLDGSESLYYQLQKVDEIILSLIPQETQEKYPKQLYFLRLNTLDEFSKSMRQGKMVIFDPQKTDEEEKIVCHFCQHVANKFYKNCDKYEQQPVEFSIEKLEEYLENNK